MRRERRLILEHVREVQPVDAEGLQQLVRTDLDAGLGDETLVVAHGRACGHGRERRNPDGEEPLERAILMQDRDAHVVPVAVLGTINRPRPLWRQEGGGHTSAANLGAPSIDPDRSAIASKGGGFLWPL